MENETRKYELHGDNGVTYVINSRMLYSELHQKYQKGSIIEADGKLINLSKVTAIIAK